MRVAEELERLAEREARLLSVIEGVTGYMEEKWGRLERLGVFAEYRAIYSSYLALLTDPASSLEALKRVIFLGWFSLSEPSVFTGLWDIPSDMPSIYPLLEQDRASERPDAELSWMLPWYYYISDFVFPNLASAPRLAAFLAAADPLAYLGVPPVERRTENRGQMGRYWDNVFQADQRPAEAVDKPVRTAAASEARRLLKEVVRLQRRSFWSRLSGSLKSKRTKRDG